MLCMESDIIHNSLQLMNIHNHKHIRIFHLPPDFEEHMLDIYWQILNMMNKVISN